MATLLIGYDVEFLAIGENLARAGMPEATAYPDLPQDATALGMEILTAVHREFDVPGTLFVCGRTLTHALPAMKAAAGVDLFDWGHHTYSHVLFKDDEWDGGVFRASPPEALAFELEAPRLLLKRHLGIDCIGMGAPHGYHLGLSDRPDLLQIVADSGLRYLSSWGRNPQGGHPVPFDAQPFWYERQGFPDLFEMPHHYWLEAVWFEANGRERGEEFLDVLKRGVDEIVEKDLVWGTRIHDWALVLYDAVGTGWLRGLVAYALERGVEVTSYGRYYERALAARGAAAP